MTENTLKYPKGSAIIFSNGEYSDYRMDAFVITIKDCDLPALAQEFATEERARLKKIKAESWERESPSDFPCWLIARGYAMPGDITEVHLGSYSSWEREFGVPDHVEEDVE